MHHCTLLVAEKHKIRIGHFSILREEVRLRVQLSELRQYQGIAIAPSDVPRLMASAEIFRHAEYVLQGLKIGLEMQKLTVLVEGIERGGMFVVQVLQEGKIKQLCGRPMRYGILYDNGPGRISIRLELLTGKVGQYYWPLDTYGQINSLRTLMTHL